MEILHSGSAFRIVLSNIMTNSPFFLHLQEGQHAVIDVSMSEGELPDVSRSSKTNVMNPSADEGQLVVSSSPVLIQVFKSIGSSAVGQAPEAMHLTEVKEEVANSWTENCEFKCPVIDIKQEEIATEIDQYGVTSMCWVACDGLHEETYKIPTEPSVLEREHAYVNCDVSRSENKCKNRHDTCPPGDNKTTFSPENGASDVIMATPTTGRTFGSEACLKSVTESSYVTDHMTIHSGKRPFTSTSCSMLFKHYPSEATHCWAPATDNHLDCLVCGKSYTDVCIQQNHTLILGKKRQLPCEKCGKVFATLNGLSEHKKCHIEGRQYVCSICNKAFDNSSTLKWHMNMHTEERPHRCANCGERFSRPNYLTRHLQICHELKFYACAICDEAFTHAYYLREHMRVHTDEKLGIQKLVQCSLCNQTFRCDDDLSAHMKTHTENHPVMCSKGVKLQEKSPVPTLPIKREISEKPIHRCDQMVTCDDDLTAHMKSHTENHPVTCSKEVKSTPVLTLPLKRETGEKPIPCHRCDQTFDCGDELTTHLKSCTDYKPFICSKCGKAFKEAQALTGHLRSHSGRELFHCPMCVHKYACCYDLTKHMKTHTDNKPFVCTTCGKRFNKARVLEVHLRKHTDKKPIQCPMCDQTFACRGDLIKHMESHAVTKPFICGICGKAFRKTKVLKVHVRRHAANKVKKPIQYPISDQTLACGDLTTDLKSHEDNIPFSCSKCGKAFMKAHSLEVHLRRHTAYKPTNSRKPTHCHICDKTFPHPCELVKHMKSHTEPMVCNVCGVKFKYAKRLARHQQTQHATEKSWQCHKCSKLFLSRGRLTAHMHTHAEKTVLCSVCGKAFTRDNQLTLHMRTHTGEKPFQCSLCGRAFATSGLRNCHLSSHSDDRPFLCGTCGKAFKVKNKLKRHMLIHSGEKPFRCSKCDMTFAEPGAVTSHMRVHSDERRYLCDTCGNSFKTSSYLTFHRKKHCGNKRVQQKRRKKKIVSPVGDTTPLKGPPPLVSPASAQSPSFSGNIDIVVTSGGK